MTVISWATAAVETVLPGITRQVLNGELQTLIRYVYQPGSIFPVHDHPQEQITVVISGEIEFTIAGEIANLRGGEAAVIPANVPHGARVVGSEIVETFNALSPKRETHPASEMA